MNSETKAGFAMPGWAAKLCCLAAALIWGSSFFIMKDTLDALPPNFLLGIRFTGASVILFVAMRRRVLANLNAQTVVRGLILGALLFTAYCLQTIGLTDTTAGKNAFLTGVYCVMVPFLYWAVDKVRPGACNVVAAVLCVAGIGLVSLSGDLSMRMGDALTLCAAVFYALHIVATSKFSSSRDVFVLTVWQFVGAAVLAWVVSALFETAPAASVWTPGIVGSMVYLSVMCTCVALLLQNVGTKYTSPSSASLLLSMESPSGVLFSVAFAGEVLTGKVLAGFVLIFLAVITSETRWQFLPFVRARAEAAEKSEAAEKTEEGSGR